MRLDPHHYKALKTMDLEFGRRFYLSMRNELGEPVHGDESILAGMHKTRILVGRTFTKKEREESATWLQEHGWKVPE